MSENLEQDSQRAAENQWQREHDRAEQALITLFLLLHLLAGTYISTDFLNSSAASLDTSPDEKIEEYIKEKLDYRELDATKKTSLEHKLALYPEFAPLYTHLQEAYYGGELSARGLLAIRHAHARELWRYFRVLEVEFGAQVEIPSELISRAKSAINAGRAEIGAVLGTDNSDLSVGMTDMKAERITLDVFTQLPTSVQQELLFDAEAGHVSEQSLSRYLSVVPVVGVTPELSAQRATVLYEAMVKVYEGRVDQLVEQVGLRPDQGDYLLAMLISSSTPPNAFGFRLLNEPELFAHHWENEVPETIKNYLLQERKFMSREESLRQFRIALETRKQTQVSERLHQGLRKSLVGR